MINFVAMPYITNFHSELATTNLKIDKLELVEDEVLSRDVTVTMSQWQVIDIMTFNPYSLQYYRYCTPEK